ncbi:MAG: 30S ribosomal protein S7 [Candidatus Thermoplasmatota archaeon]|nr:30S ribosomal protein S7 [Candidatus Thermoplasmatota archaeon]
MEEGPGRERLMFGRYNVKDVIVEDPGLRLLINLDPAFVPHSSARHANKPFYKSKISIVERLINGMMRTENYTGKKTKSYRAVLQAFEIIEERTKENPIQVYVRALENSAPREEVTRLKFGGISVPKSVDTSPSRRLDLSIRNITVGSIKSSHKNKKTIAQCLASELIAASKNDQQSYAISKKDELERVAKSAH